MKEIIELSNLNSRILGLNFFPKKWGWEHWFANTDKYCGKVLYVQYNIYSSDGNFHYHKNKDETFYVTEGILRIDFCEFADNFDQIQSISLHVGQSIRFKPFMRHRFTGSTQHGCLFIEASTHHDESDSYRCKWNKINNCWEDYTP